MRSTDGFLAGAAREAKRPARVRALPLLLLLALGLPAGAQEDELRRLRAENQALRAELAEARARVRELEATLGRVAPPAPGAPADPAQGFVPARELRLPPDAGATTFQDLADALVDGARALGPVTPPPGALAELASRLGPFDPGPAGAFLLAPEEWERARPADAPPLPTRAALEAALDALRPCVAGRRVVGIAPDGDPIAPRIEVRLAADAGTVSVEVLALRLQGRLLIVSLRLPWLEDNARAALGVVRAALGTRPARRSPDALPDPAAFAAAGVVVGEPAGPRALDLPGYRLSLRELPRGEWAALAEPTTGLGRRLSCGPVPGEHDRRRDPYAIRTAGAAR